MKESGSFFVDTKNIIHGAILKVFFVQIELLISMIQQCKNN